MKKNFNYYFMHWQAIIFFRTRTKVTINNRGGKMKPETSSCCSAPVTFYHVANEVPSLWICSNCGKRCNPKVADSRPLPSELFEGEKSSLKKTFDKATHKHIGDKTDFHPQFCQECGEEFMYDASAPVERVERQTGQTMTELNERVVNYFSTYKGMYSQADVKKLLATARAEYVRRVKLLETRHKQIDGYTVTSPMVYREDVLAILNGKDV